MSVYDRRSPWAEFAEAQRQSARRFLDLSLQQTLLIRANQQEAYDQWCQLEWAQESDSEQVAAAAATSPSVQGKIQDVSQRLVEIIDRIVPVRPWHGPAVALASEAATLLGIEVQELQNLGLEPHIRVALRRKSRGVATVVFAIDSAEDPHHPGRRVVPSGVPIAVEILRPVGSSPLKVSLGWMPKGHFADRVNRKITDYEPGEERRWKARVSPQP